MRWTDYGGSAWADQPGFCIKTQILTGKPKCPVYLIYFYTYNL